MKVEAKKKGRKVEAKKGGRKVVLQQTDTKKKG